jgi:hypothetical protein
MPQITFARGPSRAATTVIAGLALAFAATTATGAGAAARATGYGPAPVASTSVTTPQEAAIPYLTVLQPLAVRHHGHIVVGRIKLRALIAADGLQTTWSIRVIHGAGSRRTHHVVAHGTLRPDQISTVSAVVYGQPHSALLYDVTAANAAGGTPTPPLHARIA